MSDDEEGREIVRQDTGEKVGTTATSTSAETEYVILSKDDSGLWSDSGKPVKARSAEAAIRSVGAEGTYVAIPSRSFKPVTVKAEVVTTLKLEEAT
jgi:hypothetical protein